MTHLAANRSMPTILASISMFLWSLNLFAQVSIYDIPSASDVNPEVTEMTMRVTRKADNARECAQAIYSWIASNISYDYVIALDRSQRVSAAAVLGARRGICLGYSALFRDMCATVGVDAYIVSGYGLNDPRSRLPDQPNHAWNMVRLDGQWWIVDVTWASTNPSGNYFALNDSPYHIPAFFGWERDSCIDVPEGRICDLQDSLELFLSVSPMHRAIMEARADYLQNPNRFTSDYFGQVIIDLAVEYDQRAEGFSDSTGIALYDTALTLFHMGFEHLDTVRQWQKEARAMAGLNRARISFNTLNRESYNADNLVEIAKYYEQGIHRLEALEQSFTAVMALRQANSDLDVIRSEIARISH